MNDTRASFSRRRAVPPWVWIVAVPVALVLLAWLALAILFPPAKVRALVQAQIAGALSREVRYSDARVALWPFVRLDVIEPALAEPGGFTNGAAFQAGAIHLDLDVLALLGKRMVVRRLVIDNPSLHLVLRADGTTNLDSLAKPQPPSAQAAKPMDLEIRELRIGGGRVLVDDLKAARRTMFGIATRLRFSSEAAGHRLATDGTTEISDLAFGPLSARSVAELNNSLAKLKWKIEHRGKYDADQDRLALERLALGFDRTEVALSGLVTHPGPKAELDLKARATGVDLGQVVGFLAVADAKALNGLDASGKLDLDLAVRGTVGPQRLPVVIGSLRVADGSLKYPGAPASVQALAFTARFAPDSLAIDDLRARVASGGASQPMTGRLLVTRFADPHVWFTVQGDVDLAAVSPMVAPKDTRLGGHVALDVRGQGRVKDPGSVALDGRATLHQVTVESPALPKKIESVDGALAFSPASASIKGLTAKAGGSSFTLDASATRPLALLAKPGSTPPAGVDFTLRSPRLDMAELLPTTPGAPVVPNATGGGRVQIGRLIQGKLDVSDVTASVKLAPNVVEAQSFALTGYDGRITGNARFDLSDPQNPAYAVKARMDSVKANAILTAWTPLKDLFQGSLNTTLDLSGSGTTPQAISRSLTAEGLAAIANGTFGPTPALEALAKTLNISSARVTKLRDVHWPFHVERGRVYTDRGALRTPYGDWVVTGSAGFDGSLDYTLSGTVPRELVHTPEIGGMLGAGALTDAQGNLIVDLKLGGSAQQPRVGLDSGAMRDRVAGKVSQALQEQRSKVEQQLRDAIIARQSAASDSERAAAGQRERLVADSLARQAKDIFKGFFGKSKADTGK